MSVIVTKRQSGANAGKIECDGSSEGRIAIAR
jgi:hypothetical protein